jgi:divalent metal cation (Fe/Co/Zn/Cd) transporter
VKETVAPLLGQSPDPETITDIVGIIRSHPEVLGLHDLLVHDYGPGHIFASVHVEVDAAENVMVSHDMVDNIEQEVADSLDIMLVVHMDPIDKDNPEVVLLRRELSQALKTLEFVVGIHDLRIVSGPTHTNVIFDVVISHGDTSSKAAKVRQLAQSELNKIATPDGPADEPKKRYKAVINFDMDYSPAGLNA